VGRAGRRDPTRCRDVSSHRVLADRLLVDLCQPAAGRGICPNLCGAFHAEHFAGIDLLKQRLDASGRIVMQDHSPVLSGARGISPRGRGLHCAIRRDVPSCDSALRIVA
jgi:hypothetical protein